MPTFIHTRCSNCGTSFDIDSTREFFFCEFCGTKNKVSPSNVSSSDEFQTEIMQLREENNRLQSEVIKLRDNKLQQEARIKDIEALLATEREKRRVPETPAKPPFGIWHMIIFFAGSILLMYIMKQH